MSNQKSFKLEELAKLTDSLVIGDPECVIDNLATISSASESSITFVFSIESFLILLGSGAGWKNAECL